MDTEAAGDKLGRLIGRARGRTDRGSGSGQPQPQPSRSASIDVELVDALARAEVAEAKVAQLTADLARKEEILAEARQALRTARVALQDHIRLTEP